MVLPLRPAERHWYVIWCLSQETNSSHTCYCWLWWRCQYNASPSIHSHHVWLLLAHRLIFDPGQRAGILEEITLLNGWEIPMSQISHSGFSPIYIFLPVLDSLVDQLLLAINWPKTKIFEQQLVVSCQRNIGRFIARQLMMLWVAIAMFCLNPPWYLEGGGSLSLGDKKSLPLSLGGEKSSASGDKTFSRRYAWPSI